MNPVSINQIVNTFDDLGYRYFENEPFDLNLVGIRSNDLSANRFNDLFCLFYVSDMQMEFFQTACTTDPGLYYRENPMNVEGTALMTPGQHRGAYRRGKHRGKYEALVQAKPLPHYRVDPDFWERSIMDDSALNYNESLLLMTVHEKMIGMNIHRASELSRSTRVGKWSAGCQVIADPDIFRLIIRLCDKQIKAGRGETFTYTLITEDQIS